MTSADRGRAHAAEGSIDEHRKVRTKSLANPDETITFEKGKATSVRVGNVVVGRLEQQPGWRWSEQVKPIAGTQSCEFRHVGVALAGQAVVRMDDGNETVIRAGDVFDIPPGHDQWIVGNELAVSLVWGGWRGWGRSPVGDRILTTMLMTDLVGSTAVAARVGDTRWREMLDQHHACVREVLTSLRGQEVGTRGDGFFAVFDGAARALQAAIDMRTELTEIGLEVRIGIHTGEVEVVPGGLEGLAVHETARIMAVAGPGEILVSSTTRELTAGRDFAFVDRGAHQFKGVPKERQVFALAT